MSFWVRLVAYLLIVGLWLLFIYFAGSAVVAAVAGLLKRLAGRGETSGVPEEPVPAVSRKDAVEALGAALAADKARTRREMARIVEADSDLRDLRGLPAQIGGYYVREADR